MAHYTTKQPTYLKLAQKSDSNDIIQMIYNTIFDGMTSFNE